MHMHYISRLVQSEGPKQVANNWRHFIVHYFEYCAWVHCNERISNNIQSKEKSKIKAVCGNNRRLWTWFQSEERRKFRRHSVVVDRWSLLDHSDGSLKWNVLERSSKKWARAPPLNSLSLEAAILIWTAASVEECSQTDEQWYWTTLKQV